MPITGLIPPPRTGDGPTMPGPAWPYHNPFMTQAGGQPHPPGLPRGLTRQPIPMMPDIRVRPRPQTPLPQTPDPNTPGPTGPSESVINDLIARYLASRGIGQQPTGTTPQSPAFNSSGLTPTMQTLSDTYGLPGGPGPDPRQRIDNDGLTPLSPSGMPIDPLGYAAQDPSLGSPSAPLNPGGLGMAFGGLPQFTPQPDGSTFGLSPPTQMQAPQSPFFRLAPPTQMAPAQGQQGANPYPWLPAGLMGPGG
jgi:hypothetical protein